MGSLSFHTVLFSGDIIAPLFPDGKENAGRPPYPRHASASVKDSFIFSIFFSSCIVYLQSDKEIFLTFSFFQHILWCERSVVYGSEGECEFQAGRRCEKENGVGLF